MCDVRRVVCDFSRVLSSNPYQILSSPSALKFRMCRYFTTLHVEGLLLFFASFPVISAAAADAAATASFLPYLSCSPTHAAEELKSRRSPPPFSPPESFDADTLEVNNSASACVAASRV